MGDRFASSIVNLAIAAATASAVISASVVGTSAQAPAVSLKTPWGEPDLQGIWTDESDTPLQRPPRYASQEFFTEQQRAELDRQRSAIAATRVANAAGPTRLAPTMRNVLLNEAHRARARRGLSIRPMAGLPPLTPEAQKPAAAEREFRLALLQSTETCKNKLPGCAAAANTIRRPRRDARNLRLATTLRGMNRHDGPEDSALAERCLTGGLPEFGSAIGGSFRRIVQTPGRHLDVLRRGSGPRVAAQHRHGRAARICRPASASGTATSRGRWEGNTLVIDVTNFSPKTDFQGSRENLHLVERWTRTGPDTLAYDVTIEDPTVWTRPWTVKQEFIRQSDRGEQNLYRAALHRRKLWPARAAAWTARGRAAFAQGRGPDPQPGTMSRDL